MPIFGKRPAPVPGLRPTNPGASNLVIDNKPLPVLGLRPAPATTQNRNLGASFGTGFDLPSTQAKFNQAQNILAGKPIPQTAQTAQLSAKPMKKGGKVSSASKRADGIATKGKTKGRMI